MAIHYVDSNASGLNDGTSWANAFADLATADSNVSVNDTIHIASNHSKTYATNTVISFPDNITVISVNSGADSYEAGATESTVGGVYDYTFDGIDDGAWFSFYGLTIKSGDNIQFSCAGSTTDVIDCTLELGPSTSDVLLLGVDSVVVNIYGGTIDFNNAGSFINVTSNSTLNISETTFTKTTGLTSQFARVGLFAGGAINIANCDLTGIMSATSVKLVDSDTASYDTCAVTFTRCKVSSGQVFADTAPDNINTKTYVSSCDAGDFYHYFEYIDFYGKVLESTTVHRTNGATYDGTNHYSAEFQTTSKVVAFTNSLKYKLGDYTIDSTNAKVLTFYVIQQDASATPTALTDHECWVEIHYPDATDNALGIALDSRTTDILETAVDLPLSNQLWTSISGNVVKQQISVTLPASINKAPITAYLHLAKDVTTVDATEFFACLKPSIT